MGVTGIQWPESVRIVILISFWTRQFFKVCRGGGCSRSCRKWKHSGIGGSCAILKSALFHSFRERSPDLCSWNIFQGKIILFNRVFCSLSLSNKLFDRACFPFGNRIFIWQHCGGVADACERVFALIGIIFLLKTLSNNGIFKSYEGNWQRPTTGLKR